MEFNDFNKKKRPLLGYFICAVLGSIFGCALLLLFGPGTLFRNFTETPETPPVAVYASNTTTASAISDMGLAVNKVLPYIVGFSTSTDDKLLAKVKKQFLPKTGVLVDASGYILTNYFVPEGKSQLIVSLYDGNETKGTIVWSDPAMDISIVKIEGNYPEHANLGNPHNLKIGDSVLALGNPDNEKFQRSVVSGIVSMKNRTIMIGTEIYLNNLIQTNADINSENWGGPLININGEVIGINSRKAIAAPGIGYAVPINSVKAIIKSMKKSNIFVAPKLGIEGIDAGRNPYTNYKVDKGIYVCDCLIGSPGYIGGIRIGDTILSVNGTNINTLMDLDEAIYNIGIDGTAIITLEDTKKNQRTVNIKLEAFQ